MDVTKPNVARVWDFQLGGKDNFAADRLAADKFNEVCKKAGAPDGAAIARETRGWVGRAVRFLAEKGIDQIIDLGVGLPARGNVHEFARQINPDARTVYVDNDVMVMAHGRALLADNANTIAIHGDLRDPDSILADSELRALLDLRRPIAVLLVAVLDLLPDDQAPTSILARIRDAMAPGSYLAVTHLTSDIHEEAATSIVEEFARLGVNTPMVPRTGDEIRRLFDGWDLVEPGLVSPAQWHPKPAEQNGKPEPDSRWAYAGIGYLTPPRNEPASAKDTRNTGHAGRPRRRRKASNRADAPVGSVIEHRCVDTEVLRRAGNDRSAPRRAGTTDAPAKRACGAGQHRRGGRPRTYPLAIDTCWRRRAVVTSGERDKMTYARSPADAGSGHGRHRDWTPQPSPSAPQQSVHGGPGSWFPSDDAPRPGAAPPPPAWQAPTQQHFPQTPAPLSSPPQRQTPSAGTSSVGPKQPLADDYFRIVHDDQTGDLQLHPAIAGIGLASALLGELIWDRKVELRNSHLVCSDTTPPRTALTHRILEQVVHEPQTRPVSDWLNYLALDAYEQVAQRLLDTNHVSRVKRRKGLRNHIVYEPADSNSWAWARLSIANALNKRRQMSLVRIHLAELAKVTNLLGAVMAHYDGAEFLNALVPNLPRDVRDLLDETAAVVEARVLSGY